MTKSSLYQQGGIPTHKAAILTIFFSWTATFKYLMVLDIFNSSTKSALLKKIFGSRTTYPRYDNVRPRQVPYNRGVSKLGVDYHIKGVSD